MQRDTARISDFEPLKASKLPKEGQIVDTYLFILLLVSIFVVGGLIYALFGSFGDFQRKLARKTVIVHSTNDESIRGVLIHEHSDRLTLSQAVYLHNNGQETPVDGHAHVPVANVAWVQELPAPKANTNAAALPVNT